MRGRLTIPLRARRAVLAIALLLWGLPQASAAQSPPAPVTHTLRWLPPARGQVSGYRLYVGTSHLTYARPLELGWVAPGPDGIASQVIGGLDPTTTSYVALSALGPGGESVHSNEIEIPPRVCSASCSDHDPCTTDRCEAGLCASEPLPDGAACDDGDAGTDGETCLAGICGGAVCSAGAESAERGTCSEGNPSSGPGECPLGGCPGGECSARGEIRTIRLSWTSDPARSITVLWDAPRRSSRLRLRPLGGDWSEWTASPLGADCEGRYEVSIGELQPHTAYEYAIEYEGERGAQWSAPRAFTTAPASGTYSHRYTTAFVASMGLAGAPSSPQAARVVAALADAAPDLVLGGGGYAYSAEGPALTPLPVHTNRISGVERWLQDLLPFSSRAPFLPVYGESERLGAGQRESIEYYRRRHPSLDRHAAAPGSYSFDVGHTHYVALQSADPVFLDPASRRGQAHLVWLDQDLRAAGARESVRFTVVYTHADIYSTHPRSLLPETGKAALRALFDHHRVNLVLSGDTPGFERSHPLDGGAARPAVAPYIEREQGTVYLRAGSGGREDHLAWQPRDPAPPWLAVRERSMKSFVLLHQVDPELLLVEVLGLAPDASAAPISLDLFVLL
jgi:hypothetical protein